MFDLPFDEIAPMIDRSPEAARQLASRARRRVKGAEVPAPDPDLARQRAVVDAFYKAARGGDVEARIPTPARRGLAIGLRCAEARRGWGYPRAAAVAGQALKGALPAARIHPVLVNGAAGAVITVDGSPFAVMGFTVSNGKIVEIEAIADPERVARISAAVLTEG